jgi:uncharacterized protein
MNLIKETNNTSLSRYLGYLSLGILFGIFLVKAEVISWYRIQEMFRFQNFHMYGVIGSAVITGLISILFLRWINAKSMDGDEITIHYKPYTHGNIIGGLMFGFGWAISGVCPGPLFAILGTGASVMIVTLLSAIIGTWTYGLLKDKLPH